MSKATDIIEAIIYLIAVALLLAAIAMILPGCNRTAIAPATATASRTITVRIDPKAEGNGQQATGNRREAPLIRKPIAHCPLPIAPPSEIRIAGETIGLPPQASAEITVEVRTAATSAGVTSTGDKIQLSDLKAPSVSLPPSAAADAGNVGGLKATSTDTGRLAIAALGAMCLIAGLAAWIWLKMPRLGMALAAAGLLIMAMAYVAATMPWILAALLLLALAGAAAFLIFARKGQTVTAALKAVASGIEQSSADIQARVKKNIETAVKATGREEPLRATIRGAKKPA